MNLRNRIIRPLAVVFLVLLVHNHALVLNGGSPDWKEYVVSIVSAVQARLTDGSAQEFHDDVQTYLTNYTIDEERPFLKSRRSAKYTPSSGQLGYESSFQLFLFNLITTKYGVARETALSILSTHPSPSCQNIPITCDLQRAYRSIDGSCNNVDYPLWGSSFRPFERILPADYKDSLMIPRGDNLPNPRKITTTIHYDVISPDITITNMVPQLGQFLDHDLSLAPEEDRHCCTSEVGALDCLPIEIPLDDPFYSGLSEPQTCMPFTRSSPFCFPGASGVREQFNILTSFVDASSIYGSDDERAHQLRAFKGGRLQFNAGNPNMLPTVAEIEESTNQQIAIMGKYLSGDERVNEMPALTTLHILLFREHNRIAGAVEQINPHWPDEQIFDESRRILIAEWQNVVYGEYLPVILGPQTMDNYELTLGNGYSAYDATANPTIFNAFAAAAYRFGHTLINGIIKLYKGLIPVGSYQLKDNFFESDQVEADGFNGYNLILGGLMVQNAQASDPHVTEALSNFVLKARNDKFGADLIARNVQRGREHGIPAYNEYRKLCQFVPLTTWEAKPEEILEDTWNRLQTLYTSPLDIDLFTGGLSEIPVQQAFSGPTFNCLKAIQFRRLKYGDRFFFTHENEAGSFNPDQLANIRARTLGDIVCENSDVDMTTANVLRTPSMSNLQVQCNDPTRNKLDFDLLLEGR